MCKEYMLQVLTEKVALLSVNDQTSRLQGRIRLDQTSPDQCHQLGFTGKRPLFQLQQPFAPDEGWVVGPNADGELGKEPQRPSELVDAANAWLGNDTRYFGLSLLSSLPPGDYCIARSPNTSRRAKSIYIGNELARATENMRALLDAEHIVHATIIGPQIERAPDCCQPLVGVVICHDTGVRWDPGTLTPHQHLVLFFPFFGAETQSRNSSELLLVIPANGELVIDNLQLSTLNSERYEPAPINKEQLARWRRFFLRGFIADCTGQVICALE